MLGLACGRAAKVEIRSHPRRQFIRNEHAAAQLHKRPRAPSRESRPMDGQLSIFSPPWTRATQRPAHLVPQINEIACVQHVATDIVFHLHYALRSVARVDILAIQALQRSHVVVGAIPSQSHVMQPEVYGRTSLRVLHVS